MEGQMNLYIWVLLLNTAYAQIIPLDQLCGEMLKERIQCTFIASGVYEAKKNIPKNRAN